MPGMLRTLIGPALTAGSARTSTPLLAPLAAVQAVEQRRGRRRTLTPAPWLPPKWEKDTWHLLDEHNQELLRKAIEQDREQAEKFACERNDEAHAEVATAPLQTGTEWADDSKRIGLVCRKLGMLPQWMNDGTRVLCTILEVPQNHVISAVDPDTYFKTIPGKRKAYSRFGPRWKVLVGAVDTEDVTRYTRSYRSLFKKVGVPVKDALGGFMVTADSVVAPGTLLDVRHFIVGQHVDVAGRSIDWGFQGVVHRWGFKGGPARNTTKSHRRPGAIGIKGEAKVWPGQRLPGHMGYEWVRMPGLEILRINVEKQVLYVKGNVPGEPGDMVLVQDSMVKEKRLCEGPPFPTFVSKPEEEAPKELFLPELFRFTSPSIVFAEDTKKKPMARDKTKAKIAKVKK